MDCISSAGPWRTNGWANPWLLGFLTVQVLEASLSNDLRIPWICWILYIKIEAPSIPHQNINRIIWKSHSSVCLFSLPFSPHLFANFFRRQGLDEKSLRTNGEKTGREKKRREDKIKPLINQDIQPTTQSRQTANQGTTKRLADSRESVHRLSPNCPCLQTVYVQCTDTFSVDSDIHW